MEPIVGWKDFNSTSPKVGTCTRPSSGAVATELGVLIDTDGDPLGMSGSPDVESLQKLRSKLGADWQPLMNDDILEGVFFAREVTLGVHGVTVVDYSAELSSACCVRMTPTFLFGAANKGLGAQWQGDENRWSVGNMGQTVRAFLWEYQDIASLAVHRTKKMFKLWDEELIVRGAMPGPGAKGNPAGQSLGDWLKDSESTAGGTQVSASFLRLGHLDTGGATVPSDGSGFLGFAEHLADAIASAQGSTAAWSVTADGKDKTHTVTFA